MRTIKAVQKAVYEPIADLVTYRVMPTTLMPKNSIDPFIFLNHHGPQDYPPKNNGLPFGPHPHRGFETVTFIIEGDLTHRDSSGGRSTIHAGGVQWMRAGKGLIHAEVSSDEFKNTGGRLEILQLWINLPAQHKMIEPVYKGLQKKDIPELLFDGDLVIAHPVFGKWKDATAPFDAVSDIQLAKIDFKKDGKAGFFVPREKNILLYVIRGVVKVNNKDIHEQHIAVFAHDDEPVYMSALTDATILFGYATPFREPFVAHGPFVMNSREQILQAYEDYQNGKFGDENNFN